MPVFCNSHNPKALAPASQEPAPASGPSAPPAALPAGLTIIDVTNAASIREAPPAPPSIPSPIPGMDSQPRPIASLSIGGSAIADEHVGKKVYWKGRVQKTQHRNVDVLVESSETDDYVAVLDFDAKPDSALPDNTEISFEGTLESKIMKGEDFIHRPDGSLYSKRTWRVFLKDAKVMKPLGAGKAEGQAEKSVSFEPGPVPASDKETSRPVPGAIYSLSVYDKATGRIEVLDRSIKEKLDNFCAALDMTKASDRERFVRKCVELLGTEKAQRGILIYDSSGRPAFRWPGTGAQP